MRARAGLHPLPAPVGHRLGEDAEHGPERVAGAVAGRLVARLGVEARPQRGDARRSSSGGARRRGPSRRARARIARPQRDRAVAVRRPGAVAGEAAPVSQAR